MSSSALFLLALGLLATFAPETLTGPTSSGSMSTLAVEVAGALYLGFAILNWMAKGDAIGGIYRRPVAMGNMLHFFAVTMTLLRLIKAGDHQSAILVVALIYVVFTVGFGFVVFGKSPGSA
jgi:hypothetical protein